MPRSTGFLTTLALTILTAAGASLAPLRQVAHTKAPQPMSFSNRLLLNRAAVSGLKTIEVMLLARAHTFDLLMARLADLGATVKRADKGIGYVRVAIDTGRLLSLVNRDDIEAYQIATNAKGAWYREAGPQINKEMYRDFERTPVGLPAEVPETDDLPLLTADLATGSGYMADTDSGVGTWREQHPTFDGRGVTIAMVESAQVEFAHPSIGTALSRDGREVSKIAGILNVIPRDEPDDTRVELTMRVTRSTSAWVKAGDRTYALPRPGHFKLGVLDLAVGTNLNQVFGVLQDDESGDIWVDTNGDANFRDETAIADVNDGFDVRFLKLTYPRPFDLSFVVAHGSDPDVVHVYVARGGHQAMTMSVATGSRQPGSLARGVAPGARVLLVRGMTVGSNAVHRSVEAYIAAAKRPDVDILTDSAGINMVPDTADGFLALVFRRLIDVYGKPIVSGAGNMQLFPASVFGSGEGLSVGGSLGPDTFAALFGGGSLGRLIVNPIGAGGPAIDGAVKPDFIAPMHVVAADLFSHRGEVRVPANAPVYRLPPGYQIACCTSSSSPYAAGVVALLISAARQTHLPYTAGSLSRAMRLGSRFLAGFPASEQGNGVLDVNRAWARLTHQTDSDRVQVTSSVVHPLRPYAPGGTEGAGLFESMGWHAGMSGQREFVFTRRSGTPGPTTYSVTWIGNDGTFSSPSMITLPLDEAIALPVTIAIRGSGTHSALLDLRDESGVTVVRTQATILASEQFADDGSPVQVKGTLALARATMHYVEVPAHTTAMDVELAVTQGAVEVAILPAHGLYPNYFGHTRPLMGRPLGPGTYHVLLPVPEAGVWGVSLHNASALVTFDPAAMSTATAEYRLTIRPFRVSLRATGTPDTLTVHLENLGSGLQEPAMETSIGALVEHTGNFSDSGLPSQIEIDVPDGAKALTVGLRSTGQLPVPAELYLYDCTTGECFSYDLAMPAAEEQTLFVARPQPGRWIAAVNSAPFPAAQGPFVVEELITFPAEGGEMPHGAPRSHGSTWTVTTSVPAMPAAGGATHVIVGALVDRAVQRAEQAHPWQLGRFDMLSNLAGRDIPLGWTRYPAK